MALPNSGPLSFSAIAEELGVILSNVSLRNMSNIAGFSIPDAVSEFYGYGPSTTTTTTTSGGGGLKEFYISNPYYGNIYDACFRQCVNFAWHTGPFTLPQLGDIVYIDSDGTKLLDSGYYGISDVFKDDSYTSMEINKSGEVVDLVTC
jgi:hypothetical protein